MTVNPHAGLLHLRMVYGSYMILNSPLKDLSAKT
jgi:hypothetical protein